MYGFRQKLLQINLVWISLILFLPGGCQPADLKADTTSVSFGSFQLSFTPSYSTYEEYIEQKFPQPLGAFVSKENIDQLGIDSPANYKTVVMVAPTDFVQENKKIFTYSDPGPFSDLLLDADLIEEISRGGVVHDLGTISPGSFWNDPFIHKAASYFNGAKFVLISVHEDAAEMLAHILKVHLPEDALVIALSEINTAEKGDLEDFYNDYSQSVLSYLNSRNAQNLPLENNAAIITLEKYLQYRGAKKSEIKSLNTALYFIGDAPEKDEVFLVFFGDIMLGRFVRNLMEVHGMDYAFEKMDEDYLQTNDLLTANLEGPISTRSIRTTTSMVFGFFPDTKDLLKKYHFDILDLANNHMYDKTAEGFSETKKYLEEAGISYYGDAKDVYEDAVLKVTVGSQKLAFMGMEDVIFSYFNEERALQIIRDLSADGYKVIVTPHWGIEYRHVPNERQKTLAHSFIDAGAYAVVGHHPHVPQAYETYSGRPIFYSLGNAIFDQYWSAETQVGLSVAMHIEPEQLTIYLVPINLPQSQFQIMNSEEKKAFLEKFANYGSHPEEERIQILKGVIPFNN
jgi:hypothetical protein